MGKKVTEARYVKVASRFFLVGKGNAGDGDRHHFLDACFLCKRNITSNRHIFMYKGDAAFCSDDCRQGQMDMDAALKAVARRHRLLLRSTSLPAPAANKAAEAARAPVMMARQPTFSGLAARAPAVSG